MIRVVCMRASAVHVRRCVRQSMVKCTIDGGEKERDEERFRSNEEVSKRRGELSNSKSSCAARMILDGCESKCVWAVTYELHYIGFMLESMSQKEMATGRSESCRAATNCSIFACKGPNDPSFSTKIFCRPGNTSVIVPPTSSCRVAPIPSTNSLDR